MSEDASLDILIRIRTLLDSGMAPQDTLAKIKEEANAAGHETSVLTGHSRELHMAFHKLNELVPNLGTGLKLAMHAGPIVGAVAAVTALVSAIEFLKRRAEEAEAQAAALWEVNNDGAERAKAAAREFYSEIDKEGRAVDTVREKYEKLKTVMDEQIKGNRAILDLLEKQALARVAGDAAATEQVKKDFEQLKHLQDSAAEQRKIQELANERMERQRQAPHLEDAAAEAARRAAAGEPEDVAKAKARLQGADSQKAAKLPSVADLEKELKEGYTEGGSLSLYQAMQLHKKIAARREYEENTKTTKDWEADITQRRSDATEADGKRRANAEKEKTLAEEISKAQAVKLEHDRQALREKNTQSASGAVDLGISLSGQFKAGGGGPTSMSNEQQRAMVQLAELATGHQQNLKTAAEFFDRIATSTQAQAAFSLRILALMERMPTLERRLTLLEAQLGASLHH